MATITKGKTFTNGELVTPANLHQMVDSATVANIVNADIAANAAIADTKLATISTANKVSQSAVTNLTTDLAGKAASIHQHAISDTTGLQTALDGKAAASHTHTIANVTGLQTALDGKQASGSYAPATGIAPSAITGTAVITTDSRLSDARTPISHTHDDRYYTETEMNTLLAGKQASGSYAPATGIAPSAITGTAVITTDSRLSDARTPISHTHDDRYYTETEMNTLLAGKQASGSYAPATGIAPSAITGTAVITTDSRLSDARTPTTHTHDDRYYTETEMNTLLAGKQASGSYAASSHTHSAADITSGTLSNSRTTATSEATANAIVARESSGGTKINWVEAYSPGFNSGIYSVYAPGSVYIGGILSNNTNTGLIYTTTSDYRLKTNIEPLTDAVARLLQIPAHRFNWLADPSGQKVDGFLAHEAQAVVPESVTGTKDAVDADGKPIYQGIDQSKLVPLLVAAVQELAARVAALEAK